MVVIVDVEKYLIDSFKFVVFWLSIIETNEQADADVCWLLEGVAEIADDVMGSFLFAAFVIVFIDGEDTASLFVGLFFKKLDEYDLQEGLISLVIIWLSGLAGLWLFVNSKIFSLTELDRGSTIGGLFSTTSCFGLLIAVVSVSFWFTCITVTNVDDDDTDGWLISFEFVLSFTWLDDFILFATTPVPVAVVPVAENVWSSWAGWDVAFCVFDVEADTKLCFCFICLSNADST